VDGRHRGDRPYQVGRLLPLFLGIRKVRQLPRSMNDRRDLHIVAVDAIHDPIVLNEDLSILPVLVVWHNAAGEWKDGQSLNSGVYALHKSGGLLPGSSRNVASDVA
jgi:hypothetical protein